MDNVRTVCFVAWNQFKKWPSNPRVYLVMVMVLAYSHSRLSPIYTFCDTFGQKITPYVFPFFMSDRFTVMMILFGLVLLFCDAPFIEAEQPYIVMRSGRKRWVMGQMLYILLASIIYALFVFLSTVILLLPQMEWSMEWGKVIGTFAQTSVAWQHGVTIPFDRSVYHAYAPVTSLLYALLLCSAVSFFLGLLIFTLNLVVSHSAGTIGAIILIIWQLVVVDAETYLVNYSPASWLSLARIDTNNATLYPTFRYIGLVLLSLTAALILISVLSFRRRDIDVLKSV